MNKNHCQVTLRSEQLLRFEISEFNIRAKMASHNFIRNEVFNENVDRLNELMRFVIIERKNS